MQKLSRKIRSVAMERNFVHFVSHAVAVKPGMVSGAKISPSPVVLNAAQKNKLKDASGGMFK